MGDIQYSYNDYCQLYNHDYPHDVDLWVEPRVAFRQNVAKWGSCVLLLDCRRRHTLMHGSRLQNSERRHLVLIKCACAEHRDNRQM